MREPFRSAGWFARLAPMVVVGMLVSSVTSTTAQQIESKDLDTPYVPTPQKVVDAMLAIGRIGPQDYVIDLGSGDGRIVITAAKRLGARGFGVEIDPRLVKFANQVAREQGVADRAQFFERDLFKTDLSKASVITMYLLPDVNVELRPKLLALAPGTRIVSHDYHMGDWRADEHLVLDVPEKPVGPLAKSDIYFWVVPARVQGAWQTAVAGPSLSLTLDQRYQQITVTATIDGRPLRRANATLRGTELRLEGELEDGRPLRATLRADAETLTGTLAIGAARRTAVLKRAR
jgi:SAM-dependent methyltransferase